MSLQNRKYLFLLIWFMLIVTAPVTVLRNLPWDEAVKNDVLVVNFFQRITGLTAFILLSVQIIIGHWMNKWTQIVGSKAYAWHITQGIVIYLLVLIHPFLYMLITYIGSQSLVNALLVIVPKINNQAETYLSYGKLSLVLITLTVSAGYFRTKPFFRKHWLKLHILNYFLFYSIYYHMRIGSDIVTMPFLFVSWVALLMVTYSALAKFVFPIFRMISLGKSNEMGGEKA